MAEIINRFYLIETVEVGDVYISETSSEKACDPDILWSALPTSEGKSFVRKGMIAMGPSTLTNTSVGKARDDETMVAIRLDSLNVASREDYLETATSMDDLASSYNHFHETIMTEGHHHGLLSHQIIAAAAAYEVKFGHCLY